MTKKVISYLLLFSIFMLNLNKAYAEPAILCDTAVLIDAKTGAILAEKNANQKMYPASLTKIMTAILVIEMGELSDVIKVDDDTPYEIEGSHIALEPGETMTLKDMLYALLLPSANDAALALAKHYGGSEEQFVKLMNDKAKELGAYNTNFVNPHGLHDNNHYTTAADLALIAKYAMKNETFRKIVQTKKYEIKNTNKKKESRPLANLNKLICNSGYGQIYVDGTYISPLYEYATGIKTGYTPEAGNTLVASAEKNGTELIAVVMKGESLEMYQDAHNLFNYGFNEYESATLINKNTFVENIKIKDGDSKEISAIAENGLTALIQKDLKGKIESKVIVNEISLPLEKNDVVGKIEYTSGGKVIGTVNLITPTQVKSIKAPNTGFFSVIKKFVSIIVMMLAVSLVLLITYNNLKTKAKKKRRRKRYN